MNFVEHGVYHIYNQGNNRQPIFFQERNYFYFLEKMKRHIVPYANVIAYCLMPNHFHLMVQVKKSGCEKSPGYTPLTKKDLECIMQISNLARIEITDDKLALIKNIHSSNQQQRLAHEIGTMLSSYTRAINVQQNRSGSLFRKRTNAKDGASDASNFMFERESGDVYLPLYAFQKRCFDYIHNNPVEADLVKHAEDWRFSSAFYYHEKINTELSRMDVAHELVLIHDSPKYEARA